MDSSLIFVGTQLLFESICFSCCGLGFYLNLQKVKVFYSILYHSVSYSCKYHHNR